MRGATVGEKPKEEKEEISIHAPRERSDYLPDVVAVALVISIHAPRERSDDGHSVSIHVFGQFQSTLLVRGATSQGGDNKKHSQFQSTLLVRGAT